MVDHMSGFDAAGNQIRDQNANPWAQPDGTPAAPSNPWAQGYGSTAQSSPSNPWAQRAAMAQPQINWNQPGGAQYSGMTERPVAHGSWGAWGGNGGNAPAGGYQRTVAPPPPGGFHQWQGGQTNRNQNNTIMQNMNQHYGGWKLGDMVNMNPAQRAHDQRLQDFARQQAVNIAQSRDARAAISRPPAMDQIMRMYGGAR